MESLPHTFEVAPGYFFNSQLDLSGQVDALLCDRSRVLQLPPGDGLEQRYVPYHSVRAMFQIKNGAQGLKEAVEQSASAILAWRRMKQGDAELSSFDETPSEPISLVVIGCEGKDEDVREILRASRGPLPALVLLIEKGLLYGNDSPLRHVTDIGTATLFGQKNGASLSLLKPLGAADSVPGRLLMWVFFSVLSHINATDRSQTFKALTRKIDLDFPLAYSDEESIHGQELRAPVAG